MELGAYCSMTDTIALDRFTFCPRMKSASAGLAVVAKGFFSSVRKSPGGAAHVID